MQSEDKIRLQHILDEANEACRYAENLSFDEFIEDGRTARAIIRSIEVIGEAASKISKELREKHTEMPWNKIIGMRNHLIHAYFDIDYNTIWQTVQNNIPELCKIVLKILEGNES